VRLGLTSRALGIVLERGFQVRGDDIIGSGDTSCRGKQLRLWMDAYGICTYCTCRDTKIRL
jgi:hypothetical protein